MKEDTKTYLDMFEGFVGDGGNSIVIADVNIVSWS